jgi:hypothetical protein
LMEARMETTGLSAFTTLGSSARLPQTFRSSAL